MTLKDKIPFYRNVFSLGVHFDSVGGMKPPNCTNVEYKADEFLGNNFYFYKLFGLITKESHIVDVGGSIGQSFLKETAILAKTFCHP